MEQQGKKRVSSQKIYMKKERFRKQNKTKKRSFCGKSADNETI